MRADGMTRRRDLLHDLWMPAGVLADRKEERLGALVGERLEYRRCVARPRTIVEGQDDFVVAQEVVGFEMLETEPGSPGGVDLNRASNAERIRVVTFCRSWCRRRCRSGATRRRRALSKRRPGDERSRNGQRDCDQFTHQTPPAP